MRVGRSVVAAAVVLSSALVGGRAKGAGFASARFGGEHGTPIDTNPTALYYNPGAIGFSEGINLFLDGQIAFRHATWTHQAPPLGLSDQPDKEVGNSGTASLFNVFGGPALGATAKIGNLALGAGLFVPFGGRVSWDRNKSLTAIQNEIYPDAKDGVQRWDIINASLTFIYATVGAAYRLGPLSIGASGNLVISQVDLTQAKNPYGNGLPDTTSEGRASLDASGVNGSFGVGAMFEAVPNHFWLGASYQAQPALGQQTLTGSFSITAVATQQTPNPPPQSTPATFTQALPDIVRGGAKWRVNDTLELRVFGDFTRWSVMKSQCVAYETKNPDGSLVQHPCLVHANGSDASGGNVATNIPRNWNDTYGVRAGGSYWVKPEIELFGGLGYETGATPDATIDAATMDGNNVGIALGGRFYLFNSFYFSASYTHLQFLDRDNTGKSTLESGPNGMGVAIPTAQQDAGGKYTQWIGIIDLNAQKQF